ncbi:MAG TPA: DUF1553 domain-containing protein, partial [Pirellulales bacterium]
LPGLFRAFDFPVPDQSVERRPMTTVPQQALFGMNAPFVIEQARALAARPEIVTSSTEQKVTALHRLVLGRAPDVAEVQAALRFLAEAESAARNGSERSRLTPWQQYAQVLLLTNEVTFID